MAPAFGENDARTRRCSRRSPTAAPTFIGADSAFLPEMGKYAGTG
ncbi:MAG: hypothetical protein U0235_33875 [Polyangiaceae bacterium]